MSTLSRTTARTLRAAVLAFAALTLVLGIAYPLVMTGLALAVPPAHGSVVTIDGREVGSRLLAQPDAGARWFTARPSAIDHDPATSGGSNLGPSSRELAAEVARRRAALRAANPDAPGEPPADALTASGSGLDPDISPEFARWQAPRVAAARHLPLADVEALVARHTQGRVLGVVGDPRVNTVELNAALAALR